MAIEFVQDYIVVNKADGSHGPHYALGQIVELPSHEEDYFCRRGLARVVVAPEEIVIDPEVVEEIRKADKSKRRTSRRTR